MPKQKNHKGLQKRFKITARGKVMHKRAFGSHLMSSKNAKRRRRIASPGTLNATTARMVKVAMAS